MKKSVLFTVMGIIGAFESHLIAMDKPMDMGRPLEEISQTSPQKGLLRTDFALGKSPGERIALESTDGIQFNVALSLVELSAYLKGCIELDSPRLAVSENQAATITMLSVGLQAKELESALCFLETNRIPADLDLEGIIGLLNAHDYLGISYSQEPIIAAIAAAVSWYDDSLEKFFFERLPADYKFSLLPSVAGKLRWDMKGIEGFYFNKNIDKSNILDLLEVLIDVTEVQLIQFVEPGAVHEKRCLDRGLNSMFECMNFPEPSEKEKQEYSRFRSLLADDYEYIKKRLEQKYPTSEEYKRLEEELYKMLYK